MGPLVLACLTHLPIPCWDLHLRFENEERCRHGTLFASLVGHRFPYAWQTIDAQVPGAKPIVLIHWGRNIALAIGHRTR